MANERRNTTQPTDWWAAWEEAAKAAGLGLAAWIGRQCNKALPKGVREKLSERATRGRPRNVEEPEGEQTVSKIFYKLQPFYHQGLTAFRLGKNTNIFVQCDCNTNFNR